MTKTKYPHPTVGYRRLAKFLKGFLGLVLLVLEILEKLKDFVP